MALLELRPLLEFLQAICVELHLPLQQFVLGLQQLTRPGMHQLTDNLLRRASPHLGHLVIELEARRPLEPLEVDVADPLDGDAVQDEARRDVHLIDRAKVPNLWQKLLPN